VLARVDPSRKLTAVNFPKELVAEPSLSGPQKDLAFAGIRVLLPKTGFLQSPDKRRVLKRPLELLRRCKFALEIDKNSPRLRRRISRLHTYMIATGGAGSFGSPAFRSGTQIMI